MSLRTRIANTIDSQYANHPDAAAMREQLDAAGVQPSVAADKNGLGQAIIDARQEERRKQVEAGKADAPDAALHASQVAIEHVTGEHEIPVEVIENPGRMH